MVFCEKTLWSSVRRLSSHLWEDLLVFYLKTFWYPMGRPSGILKNSGLPWEDFLIFSMKVLWTSIRTPFNSLSEELLVFCVKSFWNFWSSLNRTSGILWKGLRETWWPSIRRHYDFLWKDILVGNEKTVWCSMRTLVSLFNRSILDFF